MNVPRLRHLLPAALAAAILGAGNALAATDGDWSFSYSGDTATITGYSGSSSVVTIPSSVERVEESGHFSVRTIDCAGILFPTRLFENTEG
ncbi:MAG: hypothetical protein II840_06220 [Kiritimatiellae bacterium]|nr:hypothetical protein [Kiritimatiellia bacterium]